MSAADATPTPATAYRVAFDAALEHTRHAAGRIAIFTTHESRARAREFAADLVRADHPATVTEFAVRWASGCRAAIISTRNPDLLRGADYSMIITLGVPDDDPALAVLAPALRLGPNPRSYDVP